MTMKISNGAVLLVLILAGNSVSGEEVPRGPQLGEPASQDEISAWEMGVMPDGGGLPEGSGDALQGKRVYEKYCVSCHGPAGAGGSADQLAGAQNPLTHEYPEQTIGSYWPYATTVFDMVRRSMPMNSPGVLNNDNVYAVTAYLLFLNNIIDETTVMNRESLPEIIMPNRGGFIDVYASETE